MVNILKEKKEKKKAGEKVVWQKIQQGNGINPCIVTVELLVAVRAGYEVENMY